MGPHRNQYDEVAWDTAQRLNGTLPEQAQQRFAYPHLPTMLASDPTEAVHSELILTTYRRYFTVDEFRPVGGAIAYPLLTHNAALRSLPVAQVEDIAAEVMRADGKFLARHPDSTLFAFWYGRGAGVPGAAELARWEREENEREARARTAGGRYYPATPVAIRYDPSEAGR